MPEKLSKFFQTITGSNSLDPNTAINIDGNLVARPVTTVTTIYTIAASDSFIKADATAGGVTVTLPDATLPHFVGRSFIIKKIDSSGNAVTVACNGSQTIDGVSTQSLVAQNNAITVHSDGVNWVLAVGASTAGAQAITSASATSFVVGPNGTTNPVLQIDSSVASQATGLKITGNAAGAGVTLTPISSNATETLILTSKSTAAVTIKPGANGTQAVAIQTSGGVTFVRFDSSNSRVGIGPSTAPNATLDVGSTSALAFSVGANGTTNPVFLVDASTASVATGIKIKGAAAGSSVTVSVSSSGSAEAMVLQALNNTNSLTINDTLAAATSPLLAGIATDTITAGVTDAFTGGLRLSPTINAATAQTVTRYNYFDLVNPVLGGVGPAAITDAAVMRFNAAAGTHKAVDAGTTKTTPGTVTQWIKVNVNGTIAYIPSYSSKTS